MMPRKKNPAGTGDANGIVTDKSPNIDSGSIANAGLESKGAGKKKDERARNYATVVYPESAPADWVDRLSDQHVAALISPLHDRDVNPDGKQKKPHYHVMLMFDGKKTFETQVKPIFDAIGGVGREMVNSMRGYARYMCHLDNPEKAQYSPNDVVQLGGADYEAIVHLPTDDYKMLIDIFSYIRTNQIFSLAEMIDICADNHLDWFAMVASNRAYIVDKYIKSLKWELDSGYERAADQQVCDSETGEVKEVE